MSKLKGRSSNRKIGKSINRLIVSCLVGAMALTAQAEEVPFVKVEWSQAKGERWTVQGLADRATKRPMTKDTVFAICSNTKPVTSVLALTFVEEGKIDLNEPVAKYLPQFADIRMKKTGEKPKNPLLLKHLITHLSGLIYSVRVGKNKPDMVPYEDQIAYAIKKGLAYEPGEKYVYNGIGFAIMGAILEKVSGKRTRDLMKERIFDPLEMHETTFYPTEEMLSRAAIVYDYSDPKGEPKFVGFSRWAEPLSNPSRVPMMSSGLFCTTGDYLKFSQMIALKGVGLNGRRIISEATFEKYLLTRQTPPNDPHDTSFDIAFNKEHTGGNKGGLYGTMANWNWAEKSCVLTFRAKLAKRPVEMKKVR